jgi:hypothetical protein
LTWDSSIFSHLGIYRNFNINFNRVVDPFVIEIYIEATLTPFDASCQDASEGRISF